MYSKIYRRSKKLVDNWDVSLVVGNNDFLLKPDGFIAHTIYLLKHPHQAKRLGEKARETIRHNFLITRLLSDYLDMLNALMGR